jgi:endonuclease/exonuclease/phosphatase family metal-dependent hydrolase
MAADPVPDAGFSHLSPLRHELAPHYEALRALRRRRDLLHSALYPQIRAELVRVLGGVERGVHAAPRPAAAPDRLRVVAWNIQRGSRLDELQQALRSEPMLSAADVILLSEVDSGMGRSGNRNVARELAAALCMHYAFTVSYLVLGDDFLENPEGTPNTLALAGAAILSRWPLGQVINAELPELRDKFSSRREKRLGSKRALLAEVLLPEGPLWCAGCHLDSNASPAQRARQLDALLAQTTALPRVILGGDWNTTTYDASGPLPLMRDLLHKLLITGFVKTVDGYMTPEHSYALPLFAVLDRHGFALGGYNDRARGTYRYDVMSPYAVAKLHAKVGRLLTRWLQRRLRPWKGVVPARLDWFAGRGVSPLAATVVEARDARGVPLSDHAAIVVDLQR